MPYWIILLLGVCFSCSANRTVEEPPLKSISIIDRNGLSETISSADRLEQFENVDFLMNQPYQKVLQIFDRDSNGNIVAYVTSYHPNGQPKQYLEVVNARAFGKYQEWYANGTLKLDANVVGGVADISANSEQSWLFNGCNQAWSEDGKLEAEILYEKGEMQGVSTHYHVNGNIWRKIPYNKNLVEGTLEVYLECGQLMQKTEYVKGVKNGSSVRYWGVEKIASEEVYKQGLLTSGKYYDLSGQLISEIKEGTGFRVLFSKENVVEMHEYKAGFLDGEIKVFGRNGNLTKLYHVKNNAKDGEEISYYETQLTDQAKLKPKISVHWYKGKIQGLVKSWYDNGITESQREMSNNVKHGMLTAWYRDGNLMLIEEYDHDKLVKGEYFKKGEKKPVSLVVDGKGVANFFDAEGHFIRKVSYLQGKPLN